jgi:hypothetical protein
MMRWIVIALLLCVGCEALDSPEFYRALPVPDPERPVVNPHVSYRQSNWRGPKGQGSCVHASLTSMLRWQNQFELAARWRATYGGDGEYDTELRSRLDEQGIPFAYTINANLKLLDIAHATRRGALLWWKPNHCCMFCGWVSVNGQLHAVILDNNHIQNYELVERSQFQRLWAGYGGFALTTLYDPPSPPLYQSFERR